MITVPVWQVALTGIAMEACAHMIVLEDAARIKHAMAGSASTASVERLGGALMRHVKEGNAAITVLEETARWAIAPVDFAITVCAMGKEGATTGHVTEDSVRTVSAPQLVITDPVSVVSALVGQRVVVILVLTLTAVPATGMTLAVVPTKKTEMAVAVGLGLWLE